VNPSRAIAALTLALFVPSLAAAEGPLTLEEALELAARANPDLVMAREDATSAGADRMSSVGGVLPRLDVSAGFGRNFLGAQSGYRNTAGIDVPAQPASDQSAYSLNATLTQVIFDWSTFQDVKRSGASSTAAARRYDEAALQIAFNVTGRFFEVVRAERTLAVLEKSVARTEDLVKRADALYSAGRAPRSDTYTNRVNLANDRIAVEGQRARVVQARTGLGQLIGRTGPDAENLAVALPPEVDRPDFKRPGEPPPVAGVQALAEQRRPSIAAAKAQVAAAEAAVATAQGGYIPTVDARVTYSRGGPELSGANGVYGNLSENYTSVAQVVASWNIFEGRRTSAAVQRAESQARRARASYEAELLAVGKEISDARAVAASRSLQVGLAADNLAIAEQALALARERLDAGLATQLEVRDASLNLTRAELSLVEARIDHAIAIADLARASGGPL